MSSLTSKSALGLTSLLVALALSTSVASAKEGVRSQAAAAYEAGKGELRAGKFESALKTFRSGLDAVESDQLETWQLLLGAALASEKLEKGADAIEYYRRFLDASEGAEKLLPPKWRERRQVVSDAVDELQRKLNLTHGYLTISSTPPKAAIFVNGVRAGVDANATTPFGLFLKGGSYEIRIERGGFEPSVKTVELEVGKLKPLALTMTEVVVAPPVVTQPAPAKVGTEAQTPMVAARVSLGEEPSGGLSVPGWALIGSGGAVVIGGIVMTVLGAMTHADMAGISTGSGDAVTESTWNELEVELDLYNTLSGAMYGVGAAASVAGLILVVLDTVGSVDQGSTGAEASFHVSPTPGGAFGQATLRF